MRSGIGEWLTYYNSERPHSLSPDEAYASHHNPILKTFADRLRTAGKPHKLVITAVARKLVTIVNAIVKSAQTWRSQTP